MNINANMKIEKYLQEILIKNSHTENEKNSHNFPRRT